MIMTELEQFRAQKDTFFKTHPQSPLLDEQQNMLEGLRFSPRIPRSDWWWRSRSSPTKIAS